MLEYLKFKDFVSDHTGSSNCRDRRVFEDCINKTDKEWSSLEVKNRMAIL